MRVQGLRGIVAPELQDDPFVRKEQCCSATREFGVFEINIKK